MPKLKCVLCDRDYRSQTGVAGTCWRCVVNTQESPSDRLRAQKMLDLDVAFDELEEAIALANIAMKKK